MRICIIRNPQSGTSDAFTNLADSFASHPDLRIFEVADFNQTMSAVEEAARDGFDVVVAAGGDGTVHGVANGLMAVGHRAEERPVLAILPLGTGNDYARTLGIPLEPDAAFRLIEGGARRTVEVIGIDSPGYQGSCAINVVSGGFAAEMRQRLDGTRKKRWGPASYLIAALETLPNANAYSLALRLDDGDEEVVRAHSLIVASGRMAGGGGEVAPMANPEDGWLDIVLVHEASVAERAKLAAKAALSDYLESDLVETRRARRLELRSSSPRMQFTVDGELKAATPIRFEVIPRAIRVVVGPEYVPEPTK